MAEFVSTELWATNHPAISNLEGKGFLSLSSPCFLHSQLHNHILCSLSRYPSNFFYVMLRASYRHKKLSEHIFEGWFLVLRVTKCLMYFVCVLIGILQQFLGLLNKQKPYVCNQPWVTEWRYLEGLMVNVLLSTEAKDIHEPGHHVNRHSGLTCSSAIRVSCSAT